MSQYFWTLMGAATVVLMLGAVTAILKGLDALDGKVGSPHAHG